jgi:membrane-associated phospholipid phosphatase
MRITRFVCTWIFPVTMGVVTACLCEDVHAADPDRVEWIDEWHRVRLAETIDAVALGAGSLAINTEWDPPKHANWTGGILFDKWARNEFLAHTPGLQRTAATYSDDMMLASIAEPFAVDVYFVTLGVHQNVDVAGQMLMINLQSLALTGFLSLLAEHAVGRQRPYVPYCGPDGHVRNAEGQILLNSCSGPADNQSFFSGHSAITATVAGLTCVHHQHLPLYGGGAADLAPCLLMIGASITTGFARLMADKHWASDVVIGWSLGTFSGYVLPSILHYGFGRGHAVGAIQVGPLAMMPTPEVYTRGAGLGIVGIF